MLKPSLAALALCSFALCALAAPAMAQTNLDLALKGPVPQASTANRTCAQIQGLVSKYGKTVLSSPGSFGFYSEERVVADQRFCLPRQGTTPVYLPTRDVEMCLAGYSCTDGGNSWGGRRGW